MTVSYDFGWGYYYGGKDTVKGIGQAYTWTKKEIEGGTTFAVEKYEEAMSSTRQTLFAVIGVMAFMSLLKMQFSR
jgi:hypothetical protein